MFLPTAGCVAIPALHRFWEEIMSGGGGGGGVFRPVKPVSTPTAGTAGGAAGGGIAPADPCNIIETTPLNSPNRTVLAGLRTGDTLNVVFDPGPPQRLLAQTQQGAAAGSITSPMMLQIMECITQGGHTYVAEVISVNGAICRVRIHPL